MGHNAFQNQTRNIVQMRALTGAIEVRQGHMPMWMMRAAWPHLGDYLTRNEWSGWRIANLIESRLGLRLDHWGSSKYGTVFVNEPYASHEDYQRHIDVAELLGLELDISPRSWWYPGYTTRFEFRQRTQDATPDARKPHEATRNP